MDPNMESFDWNMALPAKPAHPMNLDGTGVVCETKRFDSFYNSRGERVVLPAGKKYISKTLRANESALTVTNYWDSVQDLQRTDLEIKSPFMKEVLKAVVPTYATFNINIKNIAITGAPHCLFHYRDEILAYGQEKWGNEDAEPAKHIQHLIAYMWDVFSSEIFAFNALEWLADFEPSLQHEYLWTIFKPGDLVYVRTEPPWAFRFETMKDRNGSWHLEGFNVCHNGDNFGFSSISCSIDHYEGLKPLNELIAIPMDRLPKEERHNKREILVSRGRKYMTTHGKRCFWYEGIPGSSSNWIKTRVMADYGGSVSFNYGPRVTFRDEKKKYKPEDALQCLEEDDLITCDHKFAGYSLNENRWGIFYIDGIKEVEYDLGAFDHLILPEDQKRHLLSLVRVHGNDESSFDDLIKGKGKGMTFLLYGDPGLGKTMTAESVADYCKKPLLRLDAATLGTSPKSVETGLKEAFRLAERWRAVLLLDEADVYLEQRGSRNLTHNGVISVFLRMIEYYHGILFLTTNRISSFDTAFVSRIHLAIHYPPLALSSRSQLLYTFLKQISQKCAEDLRKDGSLEIIAKERLNGRQIKNLVSAAYALARGDRTVDDRIFAHHLEIALRPMKTFNRVVERARLKEERKVSGLKDDVGEQEQEDKVGSDGGSDGDLSRHKWGNEYGNDFKGDDDCDDDDDEEEQRGSGDYGESETDIDLTGEQNVDVGIESGSDDDDEEESDGNHPLQQAKRRRLM